MKTSQSWLLFCVRSLLWVHRWQLPILLSRKPQILADGGPTSRGAQPATLSGRVAAINTCQRMSVNGRTMHRLSVSHTGAGSIFIPLPIRDVQSEFKICLILTLTLDTYIKCHFYESLLNLLKLFVKITYRKKIHGIVITIAISYSFSLCLVQDNIKKERKRKDTIPKGLSANIESSCCVYVLFETWNVSR